MHAARPTPLQMVQTTDRDGVQRLTLLGELDIATEPDLTERVERLRQRGEKVRIDLSDLDFIDVRGYHALGAAVHAGQTPEGRSVEIDRGVSRAVGRLFALLSFPGDVTPA